MQWDTPEYLSKNIDSFYKEVKPLISDLHPYVVPVEFYIYQTDWTVIPYNNELSTVSEDGFTVYKDGKYNIFMRDSDEVYHKRSRFTMAHEIGHIVLNHHKILGGNLLTLNSSVKNYVEFQANVFAENILMPVDLILDIKDKTSENLSEKFNVSKKMAEVRMAHFERDLRMLENFDLLN